MHAVVLDTDVAPRTFKRRPAPILTRLIGFDPVITFVTRGELIKWAVMHGWGRHNRERLTGWLAGMPILSGDEQVADVWGMMSGGCWLRRRACGGVLGPRMTCGSPRRVWRTGCRWRR